MTSIKCRMDITSFKNYALQLEFIDTQLSGVSFVEAEQQRLSSAVILNSKEKYIHSQFKQYFENPNIHWDIAFFWPKTSAFQLQVLNYLQTIPLGSTKTYGEIAKDLHSCARAVGNACRKNPFPIIIPCHRVVAKNGLGGYDGDRGHNSGEIDGRLRIKHFLLQHEKKIMYIK